MAGLERYDEEAPQLDVGDQIIVGFNPKIGFIGIEAALEKLSKLPARVLTHFVRASPEKDAFFGIAVIRYDGEKTFTELQEELKKDEHIASVERNASVRLSSYNDPLLAQQWALAKLEATDPWTVTPPAGKTIVAIVDSGLRRWDGGVHLDMGTVEPLVDCQPQPAGSFPGLFLDGIDNDGHGTLLAGTIAAVPGNAIGVASPVPTPWNISLMPVKFFDAGAPATASNAAIAIVHAAIHFFDPLRNATPVKVINLSWHVAPGDWGALVALNAAITFASMLGCLVVFAAGNDGTNNEVYPTYPANLGSQNPFLKGQVLTVLATDRYDAKASFSNYGRHIVDIGAPGLHILSTGRYLVDPPRYAEYSGTSPAAAYVSAGAALVFALNPQNWDGAGAPCWTPHDVAQHLKASGNTIQGLRLACIHGKRLNLRRAVYGPLRITAPAAGAVFTAGLPNNITWTLRYNNPKFTRVKIEFSTTGNPPYTLLSPPAGSPIGAPFMWTPTAADKTPNGRIRITPIEGNFPRRSRLFKVV
jgi:subtilisin family serine protease